MSYCYYAVQNSLSSLRRENPLVHVVGYGPQPCMLDFLVVVVRHAAASVVVTAAAMFRMTGHYTDALLARRPPRREELLPRAGESCSSGVGSGGGLGAAMAGAG